MHRDKSWQFFLVKNALNLIIDLLKWKKSKLHIVAFIMKKVTLINAHCHLQQKFFWPVFLCESSLIMEIHINTENLHI